MQLVTKLRLYRKPYTICYISEECLLLPDEQYYKEIGLKTGECCEVELADEDELKPLVFEAPALFLKPFMKECMNSEVYRTKVLNHLNKLSGNPLSGVLVMLLILEPPDKEILDYAWSERLTRLIWTRVEVENAFSWLSTLGGAYSALGDYFEHCAEEAGRISVRQYKLSKMLGDEGLAARSQLYSALSHAQRRNLRLSRHIVRNVHKFAIQTKDKRLVRMCQGVWAKLKYLRQQKQHTLCKGDQ